MPFARIYRNDYSCKNLRGTRIMLALIELFLAFFAIYGALKFSDESKLLVTLACLVVMFVIGRIDRQLSEKRKGREEFLKARMEEILEKEEGSVKNKEFFVINSLLWPKSEFMLIEAVHFVFKDLKFKVSTGGDYHSVDRIVRIPGAQVVFGVEVLMSEKDVGEGNFKIDRAMEFEKEKKEGEKTLIIASTHIHLQLAERAQVTHISKDLADFLAHKHIIFLSAHHLYQLWQKVREDHLDAFKIFQQIYSHPGGVFVPTIVDMPRPVPIDLPRQTRSE
jgi:hypothetical protein